MGDSWRPDRSEVERLARAQLSMTPGTALGRIAQATPVRNSSRQENGAGVTVPVTFSFDGAPEVGNPSPAYFNVDAGASVGTVVANTTSTTTGSSSFQLLRNGAAIATLTLSSGAPTYAETLVEDVYLDYGDRLQVVCTALGGLLADVVVQVLLSADD